MNPEISVIVPIYGVEKYIARCAERLFNQTMTDSVEFIFVNDATKDNSIGVLRDVISQYPRLESRIRIISHNENKGLPSARNTGLAAARGEYIVHIDGDDFAEPTMLEDLYAAIKKANADFAWSDYYISFGNKNTQRLADALPEQFFRTLPLCRPRPGMETLREYPDVSAQTVGCHQGAGLETAGHLPALSGHILLSERPRSVVAGKFRAGIEKKFELSAGRIPVFRSRAASRNQYLYGHRDRPGRTAVR